MSSVELKAVEAHASTQNQVKWSTGHRIANNDRVPEGFIKPNVRLEPFHALTKKSGANKKYFLTITKNKSKSLTSK